MGFIQVSVNGIAFELETAPQLFSPSAPDRGTLAMLAETEIDAEERVLDLGCGYGLVGVYAALAGAGRVTLLDVDPSAVEVAKRNIARHAIAADVIVSDAIATAMPATSP